MRITFSNHASRFLNSQDKPTKQRIKNAIMGLTETPPIGDIKALNGFSNAFRLRVGKFRIIYMYNQETNEERILHISEIGSRGDIYK